MIISKAKEKKDVLEMLKDSQSVFLLGCSECASLCGTGSPEALSDMKEMLEAAGKKVTGKEVAKTGCQVLGSKVELKPFKEAIDSADAILVMSCGAGTQAMVEVFKDKRVYPANDTDFLGNMTRFQQFDERCSMLGSCFAEVVTLAPASERRSWAPGGSLDRTSRAAPAIAPDSSASKRAPSSRMSPREVFIR